jgi:hypothetical protein
MTAPFSMSRRGLMALSAGAVAAGIGARTVQAGGHCTVVELFTSQGCSSCPPADAFMQELAAMKRVLALTFNVDYWDYLGWRDTLANAAYSQRQYDYAKARGDMDVYTPQMIVDGGSHYVGSKKSSVLAAVSRSLEVQSATWVPIDIAGDDKEFTITVAGMPAPDATLWVMGIATNCKVKIEKGENAGHDIVYRNVVRTLMPAGMWHGEALTVTLPRESVFGDHGKSVVALLQQGSHGRIQGAATWGAIAA